jgi:hypothetical protein
VLVEKLLPPVRRRARGVNRGEVAALHTPRSGDPGGTEDRRCEIGIERESRLRGSATGRGRRGSRTINGTRMLSSCGYHLSAKPCSPWK